MGTIGDKYLFILSNSLKYVAGLFVNIGVANLNGLFFKYFSCLQL